MARVARPAKHDGITRYKKYLRSDRWKKIKRRVHRRAGGKCECCGNPNRLGVHHLTYSRLYRERLSDLVLLCLICHAKEHPFEPR